MPVAPSGSAAWAPPLGRPPPLVPVFQAVSVRVGVLTASNPSQKDGGAAPIRGPRSQESQAHLLLLLPLPARGAQAPLSLLAQLYCPLSRSPRLSTNLALQGCLVLCQSGGWVLRKEHPGLRRP